MLEWNLPDKEVISFLAVPDFKRGPGSQLIPPLRFVTGGSSS